jgi:hypothetical protein
MRRDALVLALLLVACRDKARDVVDAAAPPSASEPAPTAATASATHALTDEEQLAKQRYVAAIKDGNAKTVAKDYAGAIGAFDLALAAKPDDPYALSSRGYARVLDKDYEGAVRDLERALDGADKPHLQAMIYYNLGLAAEGRGDVEGARVSFARSDALHSTPDSKKKLAGKSACTARVEKPGTPARAARDASAVWDALADAYKRSGYDAATLDAKPSGDAAIKRALCKTGCDAGPWVARLGAIVFVEGAVVDASLHELPAAHWGICGGERKTTLARDGDVLRVHVRDDVRVRAWVKPGTKTPCGDQEACVSGCFPSEHTDKDFFLDTKRGVLVATVAESAPFEDGKPSAPSLSVTLANGVVTIEGAGCKDETVTLR